MKPYLLAAASGALYALGYEHAALWPLMFAALAPLLYALERHARSPWRALRLGLCAGTLLNGYAYRWLLPTIGAYGGMPGAASALAWLLLMLYQAGQLALWCALVAGLHARGWALAAVAPLAFGALEQLYPALFPSPLAASLHAAPVLLQTLELAGTAPLTMLLVLVGARIALLASATARGARLAPELRGLALVLAAWLALGGYGAWRMRRVAADAARAPALTVGLVQPNLGTSEKRHAHAEVRRRHREASRALEAGARPDLLIWPETALAGPVAADSQELSGASGRLHTPLLTGAVAYRGVSGRARLFNSAFLLDAQGRVLGRSDKLRLVPFAERLPFGEVWPRLYELVPGAGQFTPGRAPAVLQLNGRRIAALICYEDILPDLVRDVMNATSAELLVDLTNDAWFGDSAAPRFHLGLATLRAIEHRRFLVRATNSGISAVIDSTGTVRQQTATFTRATLTARVALLSGKTLYAGIGDAAGYAAVLACAVLLLLRKR